MSFFNRLLVAPGPGQLVAALLDAAAAANDDLAVLPTDREHWEHFAARMAGHFEGCRQRSDARQGDTARVVVSWWTDHVERRHVRVAASNSRDLEHRFVSTSRHDSRPPLWHVYPDRVFYREKRGEGEWWCVCACGAAGRPNQLAWMGPTCGVCHDRQQEGQSPPVGGWKERLTHPPSSCSPAISPDGAKLAVVVALAADLAFVRVIDLASGDEFDLPTLQEEPQTLAFSPDGRMLAYTEGTSRLLVHDLAADVCRLDQPGEGIARLAFSPAGDRLAVTGEHGLEVRHRAGECWTGLQGSSAAGGLVALAFAPSGRLALGGRERLRVAEAERVVHSLDALVPTGHVVTDLAFLDERHLVALSDPQWLTGEPSTLQIFELQGEAGHLVRTQSLRKTHRLRLSPCGRLLVVLFQGEKCPALFDVPSGAEIGRVGWDTETPPERAVPSPDGRTLVLVNRHGTVKLVPWAALLA